MLVTFRPCFTASTFRTFTMLVAGLFAQPVGRTVCGMLAGAGLARIWYHSRVHRFFSRAGVMMAPWQDRRNSATPNNWVLAAIIVRLPFCSRPLALPVLAAVAVKGGVSKPDLARGLLDAIAERFPDRDIHLVADYGVGVEVVAAGDVGHHRRQ